MSEDNHSQTQQSESQSKPERQSQQSTDSEPQRPPVQQPRLGTGSTAGQRPGYRSPPTPPRPNPQPQGTRELNFFERALENLEYLWPADWPRFQISLIVYCTFLAASAVAYFEFESDNWLALAISGGIVFMLMAAHEIQRISLAFWLACLALAAVCYYILADLMWMTLSLLGSFVFLTIAWGELRKMFSWLARRQFEYPMGPGISLIISCLFFVGAIVTYFSLIESDNPTEDQMRMWVLLFLFGSLIFITAACVVAWSVIKEAIYEILKIGSFVASIIVFFVSVYYVVEENYRLAYMFLLAGVISWLIGRISFRKMDGG
ncbi:MAG: hypothetical protein ISN29_12520 [Gammaproteobacteria bacterium AqS3]|nr:hypothetical protein [Gammaproteobacteria bacterium AqS3]